MEARASAPYLAPAPAAPPLPPSPLLLSSTKLSAIASAVACFNRSVSSILISLAPAVLSFISRSSSLSPRLKGSFSTIGFGSTEDRGCHLLALAVPPGPGAVASFGGVLGDAL